MKFRTKHGLVAAAMVVLAVGAAFATAAESIASGWHQISLTSSSSYVEQGLGFFRLNTSDSAVRNGIYFASRASGVLADTTLVSVGQDTPKLLSGSVSGSAGTFYVQMSDTARTTVSLSFSSTTAASGTWSGRLSGGSGTAMDTFRTGAVFSTDSTKFHFGDSVVSSNYLASQAIKFNGETASTTTNSHVIAVTWDSVVAVGDSVRLLVISPSGKIVGDSSMARRTATDTTWLSSTVTIESGVTHFVVIVWDASQARYVINVGRLALGSASAAISATGGTTSVSTGLTGVGQIAGITVTAGVTTPQVRRVEVVDLGGDGAAKADNFANVDSNTSGFDTRLQNTAFSLNLFDANNNPVTSLASGQTILVVVEYNFGGLSSSQASAVRLLRRNASNAWEAVSNSTPDSTNGRVVSYVSNFSDFALGYISTSSSAAPNDDDCAISLVAGKTGLQGILPSFRSVRDTLMGSVFGRLFVSGYYAFGMMMLVAAGLGVAMAARR